MSPSARIFRFQATSRGYLARARTALERFETDEDVQSLFLAALELRFGIEARLFEYIDAALKDLGRPRGRIQEHAATDLLRMLTELNPKAASPLQVRVSPDGAEGYIDLHFTPVTRELASIHGRLGGVLHFNYFWQHPHWYLKERSTQQGVWTLVQVRDLIADGLEQLAGATAGKLLHHPAFTAAVEQLNDDADEPSSAS